jgi:hypothetical protein
MKNKRLIFSCMLTPLVMFLSGVAFSQEVIMAPSGNAVLKAAWLQEQKQLNHQKLSAAGTDTLFLPFFDDFSRMTVWPSAERWIDSTAFVNYNFPINPPTMGVATFDGLNKQGNPYNNTNANAVGLCDELTSRYINLAADVNGLPYNPSDSIALIFYFQRKGRGDNPEPSDSLVLQFWNPVNSTWNRVWSATGNTTGDTTFTRVKISINDVDYRQSGFRIRFRNYGSLTGTLDLWHVDYIHINKFLPPDYDLIRDYAFVYEGKSLLNTYSAIPWRHYNSLSLSQQQAMVRSSAELTLRNNNDANPFPIKVAGTVYDQFNNPTPIVGGGGLNNIVVPLNTNVAPPATINNSAIFQDPSAQKQAAFRAVYEIGQTSGGIVDDFSVNDTLVYLQDFHDYYAYDDGTAELAYGINGIGAQLAYKFDILKGDTLRAINMFWAQSGLSVTNQLFRLCIWAGTSSGPVGAPLYQQFNQSPNYTDSINGFYTYLTDPLYVPPGTWFFGFIQNNAVLLNLGLDVNTPADPSRKFINTSGSWVNSQLPGMWMIRPVFSGEPLYTGVVSIDNGVGVNVYPNPAGDFIYFNVEGSNNRNYTISMMDPTGRIVATSVDAASLDVRQVPSGFYLVTISEYPAGQVYTRKVIISR